MTLAQGGGLGMVIGVIGTYLLIQIIQTYILEPLMVGSGVHINPLFTILAIVAAELVWGVGGMAIAVPMLGIVKIICDHVEPLKPYGYLIGEDKKKREAPTFIAKILSRFK
jgi:predicted PurR-regulated permease PerM